MEALKNKKDHQYIKKIKLYRIVFWPILILVVSFVIMMIIISQVNKIQEDKKLQQDLVDAIISQESYIADELVLQEYPAIQVRLQRLIQGVAAQHHNAIICINIIPKFQGLKNDHQITYCNDKTSIESFLKSGSANIRNFHIDNEEIALIKYKTLILPSFTEYLSLDALIAILFAALVTFVAFYFLIKKIQKNIIDPFQKDIEQKTRFLLFAEMAKQLAHDIRGPLIILSRLLQYLAQLPEKERVLLKNAIQRITDMANNLLVKYQNQDSTDINSKNQTIQSEIISDLLDKLISEKRFQYKKQNVVFYLVVSPAAYSTCAMVDRIKFRQSLSNLIDNAVESSAPNKGKIKIRLSGIDNRHLSLQIEDNGCGIASNMFEKILQGGVTSKPGGHGIGLSAAKKIIEEWNGSLSISSQVGCGTKITILLPKSKTAEWFSEQIVIVQNSNVVILDDDEPIHCIWDNYFKEKASLKDNIQINHFYNHTDFMDFYKKCELEHSFFLIDNELLNCNKDGLEVIEECSIAKNSILVTNQYDSEEIRTKAKKLMVKIIPKGLVPYIQLKVIYRDPDYILLDDDSVVRDLWQFAAECAGKKIVLFCDSENLMSHVFSYAKTVPIYIDSELGQVLKGEVIAKKLYELGYVNLYLCTGSHPSEFKHVTWVKGITGKKPPC